MSTAKSAVDLDPLIDKLPSRYVVGIDLGTTNSAVTYVDTQEATVAGPRVRACPSWSVPVKSRARDSLPSFHYQPADRPIVSRRVAVALARRESCDVTRSACLPATKARRRRDA